jgi:hypothetical protein
MSWAGKNFLPQRRNGAKRCRVAEILLCAFAPLRERSSPRFRLGGLVVIAAFAFFIFKSWGLRPRLYASTRFAGSGRGTALSI